MAAKKKRSAEKVSKRAVLGGTSASKASKKRVPKVAASKAVVTKAAASKAAVSKAAVSKAAVSKAAVSKAVASKVEAKKPAKPTPARTGAGKPVAARSAPVPARKTKEVVARRPATAALRAAQKAPAGSASLEDAASPLSPGDGAPSFELPDQQGATVSSASLAGQPYVLYFYPKDDTPGCTTQACGFRDAFPDFESAGVRVLGVSPDSVASHQKFVGKYGLPFTLLSDSSRELAGAYGVWALKKNYGREFMGIVRSTFLVDGEGVVRKVWRGVRVNGHVPAVQAAAAELG